MRVRGGTRETLKGVWTGGNRRRLLPGESRDLGMGEQWSRELSPPHGANQDMHVCS